VRGCGGLRGRPAGPGEDSVAQSGSEGRRATRVSRARRGRVASPGFQGYPAPVASPGPREIAAWVGTWAGPGLVWRDRGGRGARRGRRDLSGSGSRDRRGCGVRPANKDCEGWWVAPARSAPPATASSARLCRCRQTADPARKVNRPLHSPHTLTYQDDCRSCYLPHVVTNCIISGCGASSSLTLLALAPPATPSLQTGLTSVVTYKYYKYTLPTNKIDSSTFSPLV